MFELLVLRLDWLHAGMVVDTFIKQWSGPLAVIAPLYKACYGPLPRQSWNGSAPAAAADEQPNQPTFIPAYQKPYIVLTVHVAGRQLPTEIFKVEATENGHPRAYYLVQSDLFRNRYEYFSDLSEYRCSCCSCTSPAQSIRPHCTTSIHDDCCIPVPRC